MSTPVETGTREDVERLAREVMRWSFTDVPLEVGRAAVEGRQIGYVRDRDRAVCVTCWRDCADSEWNPYTDANADVQVLERVRETWGSGRQMLMERALRLAWEMRWGYQADTGPLLRYQIGDFARAALYVLNTENDE